MQSMSYKHIIHLLSRMPKDDGSYRQEWINQIGKIQPLQHNDQFQICHLHFHEEDLYIRYGKLVLKHNAIPKIFETVSTIATENIQCKGCLDLNSIRKDMDILRLNHAKEVAILNRKIEKLQSKKLDDANEYRSTISNISSQLEQERCKTQKYEEEIAQWKSKRLISKETPNVISLFL